MANTGNVNQGERIGQKNPSAQPRTPQQIPNYNKRQDVNRGIKKGQNK
jgi:hypothetical protein